MTTRTIPYGRYTVVSESGGHRTLQIGNCDWWTGNPLPAGSITVSELNYENRFRGFAVVTPDMNIRKFKGATESAVAALYALLHGNYEEMGLAYALQSGRCRRCGRELTVPASIHRGMGPDCAGLENSSPKFTFSMPDAAAATVTRETAPVVSGRAVSKPNPDRVAQQIDFEGKPVEPRKDATAGPGRTIYVAFEFGCVGFEHKKQTVKALGFRWNGAARRWVSSVDAGNARRMADGFYEAGITVDDDIAALFYEIVGKGEAYRKAATATSADFSAEGLTPGLELMPFQKAGVKHALEVRTTILADEMGLGKTVQALAAAAHTDAFPVLVIVPASLKLNWRREVLRWIPGSETVICSGLSPRRTMRLPLSKKVVVVCNYDILGTYGPQDVVDPETGEVTEGEDGWSPKGWGSTLEGMPFKTIIADEAHYAKNPQSNRSKAVRRLFAAFQSGLRLALTGTPVLNRPNELWPLLDMLGYGKVFGGRSRFLSRYCGGSMTQFGYDASGASNAIELNEMLLTSGAMIRRRKEDVLTELPEKRWVTVPVVMGKGEEKYLEAEADCIRWFNERPRRIAAMREKALAEYQRAPARESFEDFFISYVQAAEQKSRMAEHLVRFEALKTAAWVAKQESVIAWIEEFLTGTDKKLIVFGHHREAVDLLAQKFRAPRIQGGMKTEDVEEAKRSFQEDPDVRVIVCNIKAGGVGHTLTAASDVAFIEFPWTPADLDQAIDRAHRIGQRDSVTGWVLTAARSTSDIPTIEDEIFEILTEKRAVVDAVTDGKEAEEGMGSVLGQLTDRWTRKYAEGETGDVIDAEYRVIEEQAALALVSR